MTEEKKSYKINPGQEMVERIIRVRLIDGSDINGRININRADGFNRLSDLVVSDKEPFLVIIGATVHEKNLEKPIKYKTLFLNKNYIVWAAPDKSQK
jgi:hypothetical protein